ncbi:uncharacterized protein LOC141665861 [Apium graveolens]|uniref:uncharacterized protein LOC141665861 n=1 Tax=Apium graveolens TaxID=4045 RepID=UPI003D7A39BB
MDEYIPFSAAMLQTDLGQSFPSLIQIFQMKCVGCALETNKTNVRKWCKPPQDWIKINVDTTFWTNTGHIGAGCIIRDDQGQFLRAKASKLRGCATAREAEALSFKEALTWTKEWRTNRCVFELDAKAVVEVIHGPQKQSNFHVIIEECRDILKHFEEVLVIFDYRSANKVAHVLARAAYSMPDSMVWCNTAPELICKLIAEEY